jgi:glyoxylase I family protein
MLAVEALHHVSVPVSDLERARTFYTEVLGLEETARPAFPFPGAWYRVGDRTLHLIVAAKGEPATFREDKAIDSHDIHFAIRVRSYRRAVEYLRSKGYRASDERNPRPLPDAPPPMRLNPSGLAGFPQIYILDPDRNVIEINAETVDGG